jgi:hypothetical protein
LPFPAWTVPSSMEWEKLGFSKMVVPQNHGFQH